MAGSRLQFCQSSSEAGIALVPFQSLMKAEILRFRFQNRSDAGILHVLSSVLTKDGILPEHFRNRPGAGIVLGLC